MIAQITPVNITAPEPACSFCGTPESEAKILINSLVDKGKFICCTCVSEATAVMAGDAVPA